MTRQEQAQVISRLRHAVMAFKSAQTLLAQAHRTLKNQSPAKVDAFWNERGRRLEASLETSAKEVM